MVGERVKRRAFVAVEIPDEARDLLAARLDQTVGIPSIPGKVVPPENWHITLRFLGWVDEPTLDRVTAELDQMDTPPRFRVRLGGLGAFSRPARASVLWVAIDRGAEEVVDLAGRVEQAMEGIGFEKEGRPYHPHLTLSRIRPERDVRELVAGMPAAGVSFDVPSIALVESHTGPGGARYEVLERFLF